MKYALYVNDVLYEKFKTLKEVDEFIFEKGLDNERFYIQVKRINERK